MASSEKRCLYDVLGLSRDCSPDEIRSAYKRLALQRHPDKLVQSGVSESEATAAFQELVNAYEVLSDGRERAWYDSHRTEILFSRSSAANGSSNLVPDLFSFFSNSVYSGYSDSGKGFYKVYGDLFEKVYANELGFAKKLGLDLPREAPLLGNLESPYAQVSAFYNYWFGFSTSMDFFWADQYDVMAGPNRKSRRLMEDENKKLRKKARREFNETVRGLAEFVKKRDKRVIDMQVKRNEEMERKREEEKQRKRELERQRAESARNYVEPEWARIEEMEDEDTVIEEEEINEFYCIACGKKFKSDKQWKNHEQSKKHKEKVAELRDAFEEEDKEHVAEKVYETHEGGNEIDGDDPKYLSADEELNELQKQFQVNFDIQKEKSPKGNNDKAESSEDDGFDNIDNDAGQNGTKTPLGSDDDEAGFLQTMLSERKNRNKVQNQPKASANKVQVEVANDDLKFMEYNDAKGSRRYRGSRRQRGRRQEETENSVVNVTGTSDLVEECSKPNDNSHLEEPIKRNDNSYIEEPIKRNDNSYIEEPSKLNDNSHVGESVPHTLLGSETKSVEDDGREVNHKHKQHAVNKKKKEIPSKSKVTSRQKQKEAASASNNICEKCGEEFETRNKLYKHIGDTGHATLRYR